MLKSLLFNSSHHWIQRGRNTFDITMGAYDFAEICELVGTFLLLLLRKKYNSNNIGLYRDDRLSVFKNISGLALSRVSYVMNIVNIANGVLFLFTWRRRFKNKISFNETRYALPYHREN